MCRPRLRLGVGTAARQALIGRRIRNRRVGATRLRRGVRPGEFVARIGVRGCFRNDRRVGVATTGRVATPTITVACRIPRRPRIGTHILLAVAAANRVPR